MGGKMYEFEWTKQAVKDFEKLSKSEYAKKGQELLEIVQKNPYQNPPWFKTLAGKFKGMISRRISQQHRLVYEVIEEEKVVIIESMWTHYHE